MSASEYRLGLILVTTSAVAWSTAGFFVRLVSLDSWTMLAWRGLFGTLGIAIVLVAVERQNVWKSIRAMRWPGYVYTAISTLGMVFFITSLKHTTVAHVAVIYATVPFFAALLGWLVLRERPSASAVIASLAALGGVAIMVGMSAEGDPFGDLLALAMTLGMSVMMVIARRYRDIPTMPAAGLSALLSSVVCWPFGHPLSVSGYELSVLGIFGVTNSAIGFALFTLGARLLPMIETALIGSLDAPLAPLWVWLAFGETPSAGTLVGGTIVFVAVVVHILFETRRKMALPA